MGNAFEPLSIMSITWDEGRLRFRQPLKAIAREKYGAPYMTAHRADLHNLLRRATGDTPLQLGAHCIGADTVNNDGGSALCRRQHRRSGSGHRRRRHTVCHTRPAFRLRRAALRRDDGLALHRADGLRAEAGRARRQRQPRTRRIFWLDRAGRPRHLLSDRRRRRQAQHVLRPCHRTMGRGILVGAVEPRGIDCREGRLERGAVGNVPPRRARLQWGIHDRDALRNGRAAGQLLGTSPIRPCRPGARRQHGDRGRLCAGAALSRHGEDVETALQAYPAERKPRTDGSR